MLTIRYLKETTTMKQVRSFTARYRRFPAVNGSLYIIGVVSAN